MEMTASVKPVKKVITIPATITEEKQRERSYKQLRVAAYCRVCLLYTSRCV